MAASNESSAIVKVRGYARATLIMYLIVIAAWLIFQGFALSDALSYSYSNQGPNALVYGTVNFLVLSVALTSAFVIVFVYSIVKIRGAFINLSAKDRKFDRPALLVNIMCAILIIAVLLILASALLAWGPLLAVTGALLGIGGYIIGVWGIALGLWRLGAKYNNTVLKVGAIIAVFSGLPGIILVYLGAGELHVGSKKS